MTRLIKLIVVITLSYSYVYAEGHRASDTKIADKISLKYCKYELLGMNKVNNAATVAEESINRKMFLYRLVELGDGKLNAYLAKDIIRERIQTYEGFIRTNKSWQSFELTPESKQKFVKDIVELKKEIKLLEKAYPRDPKIFNKAFKLHPLSKLDMSKLVPKDSKALWMPGEGNEVLVPIKPQENKSK